MFANSDVADDSTERSSCRHARALRTTAGANQYRSFEVLLWICSTRWAVYRLDRVSSTKSDLRITPFSQRVSSIAPNSIKLKHPLPRPVPLF